MDDSALIGSRPILVAHALQDDDGNDGALEPIGLRFLVVTFFLLDI